MYSFPNYFFLRLGGGEPPDACGFERFRLVQFGFLHMRPFRAFGEDEAVHLGEGALFSLHAQECALAIEEPFLYDMHRVVISTCQDVQTV